MVRPAGDGGSVDFAAGIEGRLSTVEDLLGQLRGNEAGWQVITTERALAEDVEAHTAGVTTKDWVLNFDTDYPFEGQALYRLTYLPGSGQSEYQSDLGDLDRMQAAVDAAVHGARNASSGTLSSALDDLEELRATDPGALDDALGEVASVATWLYRFTHEDAPDFVHRLHQNWPATSLGSNSFYAFFDDLGDRCTTYKDGAVAMAQVIASTAQIVLQYQSNASQLVSAAQQQAVRALENWQSYSGPDQLVEVQDPPSETLELGAEVLDGVSLVTGVVSLYPPAAVVAGPISVGSAFLVKIVGGGAENHHVELYSAAKADDIQETLRSALEKVRTEFGKALDELNNTTGFGQDGTPSFATYVHQALSPDNPQWVAKHVRF